MTKAKAINLLNIEEKGYEDAQMGISYISPYWTKDEISAWTKGYKRGLTESS